MSTRDRCAEIISRHLGIEFFDDSTDFVEDLGCDSLDHVELVMEVEDQFNINIDDDEAEDVSTVGDLIKLVERKLS